MNAQQAANAICSILPYDGSNVLVVSHRRDIATMIFANVLRWGRSFNDVGVIMFGTPFVDVTESFDCNKSDPMIWAKFARRRKDAHIQIATASALRVAEPPRADILVFDSYRPNSASNKNIIAMYPYAAIMALQLR